MKNSTSPNINFNTIKKKSHKIANHKEQKQNDKIITSTDFKTQSFELLVREVSNFENCSNQICQNWLEAHRKQSLCNENIQQYTKIVILLQDIVELILAIKATIKYTQLRKTQISQTVGDIISNCLDIEPEQVILTASLVNDLGIESLEWQELIITLSETFSIGISNEIAKTVVTVQELIDYIVLKVQESAKDYR